MPHLDSKPRSVKTITAYQDDYVQWVEDTACAIEEGRFAEIDRSALADEVRDLGKTETRELRSALCALLLHLLKARYQPEKRTRSWDASVRVQRRHIAKFLQESPSLGPKLPELLSDAYDEARIDAANETGLDIDTFPETCEWQSAEILGS
jgi:hypothetical protein